MKKILFFSCIAAALLSFVGCEETGNGYEGTNYIYLESLGGNTTVWEQDETPLAVTVMLTSALSEDLNLTFAVEGTEGVLDIEGNPVTIKAGQKTASFAIVSKNADKVTSVENFKVVLDAATVLPDKVQLKEGFSFVVRSAAVSALTDAQKDIVEAYKTATGIDLSKYLGIVNVSTVITGTDPDTYEPLAPQTIPGKTIITLSESSTADTPVLKMITNPMGIQDYMHRLFRSLTVDNEDWYNPDNLPCFQTLLNKINWTKTSPEIFLMSLDGLALDADGNFSYEGQFVPDPEYPEDTYVHVPFKYYYTAYEREKLVIDELKQADPDWYYTCTANPFYMLNNDDISEDWVTDEEEGLISCWTATEGVVSSDSMVFTFCMYACENDADFTKVVATYTPNN